MFVLVQNASLHNTCMYVPGEGKGNTVGEPVCHRGEKQRLARNVFNGPLSLTMSRLRHQARPIDIQTFPSKATNS